MYQPITGTGTGVAPVVNLTWPFIDPEHVEATVNGSPVAFTWTGASQITFSAAVAAGQPWAVTRKTPTDSSLVDFTDGALIISSDLNKAATQTLYAFQEAAYANSLVTDEWSPADAYSAGTVGRKLQQFHSVDDYASHAAADALGLDGLYVTTPVTSTLANGAAILTPLWGPEQITTADGNKRGKRFSQISARPSRAVFTDHDNIDTSYNGDWSHALDVLEFRISGTALGQPTTGYLFTPEAGPFYGGLDNTSGWNNSLSGNDGRTGSSFFYLNLKQRGQGDLMGLHVTMDVTGAKAGATSFLANPAGAISTGDLYGGNSGVYLQGTEFHFHDDGNDIAVAGDTRNFYRTNATGALGAPWLAFRLQSNGTQAVDAMLSAVGPFRSGVDFSPADLSFTNHAALLFKSDQRFYLNASSTNDYYATTVGTDYFGYSAANAGLEFILGGSVRLRLRSNGKINLPGMAASPSYASDAAAATGGVAVDEVYRNGSTLSVRVA